MNYAFWIAILVVFIAVAPAIFRNRRKNDRGGGDTAPTATGAGDRDRTNDDSGDSDGGGGDGGGGDGGGD